MQSEGTALYRQLYACLLYLYPKAYRERFGPELGQTFNDLCRERTVEGKSLFGFMLWVFSDTFIGIISTRISYIFSFLVMQAKHVLRPALITALLLIIPIIGSMTVEGWNWDTFDFVFAYVVFFMTFFAIEMVVKHSKNGTFRMAVAVQVVTMLALLWINGAVGIIGNEGNVVNVWYLAIIALGFLGPLLTRMKGNAMSYVLFTMAVIQMAIPTVAAIVFRPIAAEPPGVIGIFFLNGFFALAWVASGLMYRNAATRK